MVTTTDLFVEAAKTHGIEGLDFTEPNHHHVTSNGLRMHYVDWGGQGTPILFLHGGGQTCRTWDMTAVQLRSNYRCYALDQRNHGDTDKSASPDIDPYDHREDIRGAVEALGLQSFVMVGMSMGGLNTIAYASKYPKELQAVVIVDVGPTIRKEGGAQIGNFSRIPGFDSMEDAIEQAVKFNPLRPRAHLHYSLLHSLRQEPDGKWVFKHQLPGDRPEQPEQAGEPEQERMRSRFEKLWDDVPKITSPTLLIHGGESKVIFREGAEEVVAKLPKGSLVTIPGAGHTVQGDKPKEFVAELTKFLDRVL